MTAYCKNCHCTHSAWTRLTNGCVCGLCGTRERDPKIMPVNSTHQRNPLFKQAQPAAGRFSEQH